MLLSYIVSLALIRFNYVLVVFFVSHFYCNLLLFYPLVSFEFRSLSLSLSPTADSLLTNVVLSGEISVRHPFAYDFPASFLPRTLLTATSFSLLPHSIASPHVSLGLFQLPLFFPALQKPCCETGAFCGGEVSRSVRCCCCCSFTTSQVVTLFYCGTFSRQLWWILFEVNTRKYFWNHSVEMIVVMDWSHQVASCCKLNFLSRPILKLWHNWRAR